MLDMSIQLNFKSAAFLMHTQYWQTSAPKFGPTRYPAYRSIHWAGIGLGMLSPALNRTQFGRTHMYPKCGSGRRFFRSIGSVFACRKPGKTSVEPLMKWDYPTRHFPRISQEFSWKRYNSQYGRFQFGLWGGDLV